MDAFRKVTLKTRLVVLATITLCGLLAGAPTLQAPFQYDDEHAIVKNPYIQEVSRFQDVVGFENLFNRSILLFTFAVDRSLGGLDVFGYHLTNIALHLFNAIVLFFVAGELTLLFRDPAKWKRLPLWVALIHLLNPLSVETLTYLSSRSSLLVTLFYLLAFFCWTLWVRHGWKRVHYGIIGFIFFVLGAGTKEIIASLPLMAGVYLILTRPRERWLQSARVLALLALPLLLYLGYRYIRMGVLFSLTADPTSVSMDRGLYGFTQFYVFVFYYLLKSVLPINLNFEPDIRLASGYGDIFCWLGLFIMIAGAICIVRSRSRFLAFAMLWAVVTLLPTSSFIPLKQIATEHRMYLPGVGISLCLAGGIVRAITLSRRARICGIIILILFSLLTWNRERVFRSPIHLWEDTVRKSPNKILTHNNLAAEYIKEKRYDEAIPELKTVQRLDPTYANAYSNLGHIHFERQQWQDAKTNFDKALMYNAGQANNFYNAGLVRMKLGMPEDSLGYLQRAVMLKGNVGQYHFVLGNAYRALKLYDEALKAYRRAHALDPDDAKIVNNMGVIFFDLKSFDLARNYLQKALELDPSHLEAETNLANVYMLLGQFDQAIPHLRKILAANPENETAKKLLHIATNFPPQPPNATQKK